MNARVPVTLDDIARRLKVSKMTVSRALRDHPDISEETKQRIKKLASQLGYFPNLMARNLSSRSSRTLGLVVPKIAYHFYATVIEAIYEKALELGYEVILMISQENANRQAKNIQTLLSMQVDGVLISVARDTSDLSAFELLSKMGMPTVMFDRTVPDLRVSSVTTDDEDAAFRITDHAIRSGFSRIAHLAGPQGTNVGKLRLQGFQRAMKKHTLPVKRGWVLEGGFAEQDGSEGLMRLRKMGSLPEMIFAVSHPVALGVCAAAGQLGLSIPKDLDLICFGRYYDFSAPAITCIDQPAALIGQKAVELLVEQMSDPKKAGRQQIVVPTSLRIGDTCVPR